jgi:multidrug efflux system membrane fusion protein
MPGQYLRVQLLTGQVEPALMVPDQALGTDQGHRYVLVVGDGGVVEYRAVTVGAAHGPHRLVTSGLREGEQVIVSGLMRVRPGMTVRTQVTADPAQARASAPARS